MDGAKNGLLKAENYIINSLICKGRVMYVPNKFPET